jgi:hypothetical protein
MKQLDLELQRHRVVAKGETSAAKEAVRQVEQETLQGMRTLATGKTDIELAWKTLDTIQAKHKVWNKFLYLLPCTHTHTSCHRSACKQVVTNLFTSCRQVGFALFVSNCCNKFGTSC